MASRLQYVVAKLGERGGEAIGGAYAFVASSFLRRFERLEDLSAERRYHQRSRRSAPAESAAPAPQLAVTTAGNLSARNGSG